MVVTIIVLLILSMVSINALVGENGLITRAKEGRLLSILADIMFNLESNIVDINMDNILNDETFTSQEMLSELYKRGVYKKSEDDSKVKVQDTTKFMDSIYDERLKSMELGYNGDIWVDNYKRGKIQLTPYTDTIRSTNGTTTITAINGTIEEVYQGWYHLHAIPERDDFAFWINKYGQITSIFPDTILLVEDNREEEYTAIYGNYHKAIYTSPTLHVGYSYGLDTLIRVNNENKDYLSVFINFTHLAASLYIKGTGALANNNVTSYSRPGFNVDEYWIFCSPVVDDLKDVQETIHGENADRVMVYRIAANPPDDTVCTNNYFGERPDIQRQGFVLSGSTVYPVIAEKDAVYYSLVDALRCNLNLNSIKQYYNEGYAIENLDKLYYRIGIVYTKLNQRNTWPLSWEYGNQYIMYEDVVKFVDV